MQKQAPTVGRLATMVFFALSCFGLLLFLWLAFGGPVPLKPKGYRFHTSFAESGQLALEADVRISGVPVGRVVKIREAPDGGIRAEIELRERYAPLPRDARATLRQKTLLGETFVELTPGTSRAKKIADGGRLRDAQVAETVELDEIFQTYDPTTRKAIQLWQQELGRGMKGRGQNLNNALGQLPEFTDSGADLLEVLHRQEGAVRGLFRDTGEVYEAITRDESKLTGLIRNSNALFSQTASQREALAEAFHIFPTFLDESRLTLERVEDFSRHARPLVQDLRPVAEELRPTLTSLRSLAPDLRTYFDGFDRQITISKRSLPALKEIVDETPPLFRALGPFLGEFNPIFEWLELHQHLVADFLGNGSGGTKDTVEGIGPNETGHYLRSSVRRVPSRSASTSGASPRTAATRTSPRSSPARTPHARRSSRTGTACPRLATPTATSHAPRVRPRARPASCAATTRGSSGRASRAASSTWGRRATGRGANFRAPRLIPSKRRGKGGVCCDVYGRGRTADQNADLSDPRPEAAAGGARGATRDDDGRGHQGSGGRASPAARLSGDPRPHVRIDAGLRGPAAERVEP